MCLPPAVRSPARGSPRGPSGRRCKCPSSSRTRPRGSSCASPWTHAAPKAALSPAASGSTISHWSNSETMSQPTSHSSRRRRSRSASEAATPAGRYDKAAAVLIAGVPMLATVGYGAVDIWALIPLSALSALLAAVWLLDSLKNEEFRYSTSALQLPIGALILMGCVQLLPLGPGGPGLPGGVDLAGTLTLDPFSTGYFVIRLLLLLMFFAAALTFLNAKRRVRRVMLAIVIFGALMAFAGILQRLASPD